MNKSNTQPLADWLRPKDINHIFGQQHLFGDNGPLRRMVDTNTISSLILWGPAGCGKTTIAKVLAKRSKHYFIEVSAVTSGAADLKEIFNMASKRKTNETTTILMVDEIHRFNRAQQDLFLPYIENGTIILIGATTENPSFELNSALLSRCKVVTVNALSEEALLNIIERAEKEMGQKLPIANEVKSTLCRIADGDGRYLLNVCEELFTLGQDKHLSSQELLEFIHKRAPVYDKNNDSHYNLISALHKSLRGSDCNAALYWLSRMLDGGEDPLFILRRLIRFAVEDVGLADPAAVSQSIAAKQAYEFLGSPEGELAIAQAVVYLATAPKSNAVYTAYKSSRKDTKKNGSLMPPKHILNAPTKLMRDQGYGNNYIYDHDTLEGFSGQNYFPEEMKPQEYYQPVERGFEREIKKRITYWNKLREIKGLK